MTFSKSSSSTTIEDAPVEFAEQMEHEIPLDRGAVLRLWRTAHEIVPDATTEEIRHFFHLRAVAVYRNRRIENPTGLMLSTIADWFDARRVLERREETRQATELLKTLPQRLADAGIVPHEERQSETGCRESRSIHSQVNEVAGRKRMR